MFQYLSAEGNAQPVTDEWVMVSSGDVLGSSFITAVASVLAIGAGLRSLFVVYLLSLDLLIGWRYPNTRVYSFTSLGVFLHLYMAGSRLKSGPI